MMGIKQRYIFIVFLVVILLAIGICKYMDHKNNEGYQTKLDVFPIQGSGKSIAVLDIDNRPEIWPDDIYADHYRLENFGEMGFYKEPRVRTWSPHIATHIQDMLLSM